MRNRQVGSPTRRRITIFRLVTVTHATDHFLCRACSISDELIELLTGMDLALGAELTLGLSETHSINGLVRSRSGARTTVAFHRPIDAAAVLLEFARLRCSGVERAVRLPLVQPCAVYTPRGIRPATVLDLSQAGVKLKHSGVLLTGMKITVSLPLSLRRTGVVRWATADLAGVRLLQRFSLEEIGALRAISRGVDLAD